MNTCMLKLILLSMTIAISLSVFAQKQDHSRNEKDMIIRNGMVNESSLMDFIGHGELADNGTVSEGLITDEEALGIDGSDPDVNEIKSRMLAENHSAEELFNLAVDYLSGNDGHEKDADLGIVLMLRSAEKGHKEAQYRIGMTLIEDSDKEVALGGIRFLTLSAEQNNLRAIRELWNCYVNGVVVEKDRYKAQYYHKKYLFIRFGTDYYDESDYNCPRL